MIDILLARGSGMTLTTAVARSPRRALPALAGVAERESRSCRGGGRGGGDVFRRAIGGSEGGACKCRTASSRQALPSLASLPSPTSSTALSLTPPLPHLEQLRQRAAKGLRKVAHRSHLAPQSARLRTATGGWMGGGGGNQGAGSARPRLHWPHSVACPALPCTSLPAQRTPLSPPT